jgi:hypothetical protein
MNNALNRQQIGRGIRTPNIIRENLMVEKGYSPYCGNDRCNYTWPRTAFNGKQFECRCGWVSQFPDEFIAEYKEKWGYE